MKTKILFTLLFFACRIHYLYGQTNLQIAPETLATPEKNGIWLQPAQNTKAQPIWGFANGIRIGIAPLVWFIASPDEKDPTKAVYAEDTHTHWKYTGKKATQYWYCSNPSNELEGVVNGRYTYWASKSPIPGGIAYENFELTEPFQSGQSYIFGITPLSPEELINHIMK